LGTFPLFVSTYSLCIDCLGTTYYLNIYTKESQWDTPTKPAERASSNGPEKVSFFVFVFFNLVN